MFYPFSSQTLRLLFYLNSHVHVTAPSKI
jgi:hypothetical protein